MGWHTYKLDLTIAWTRVGSIWREELAIKFTWTLYGTTDVADGRARQGDFFSPMHWPGDLSITLCLNTAIGVENAIDEILSLRKAVGT